MTPAPDPVRTDYENEPTVKSFCISLVGGKNIYAEGSYRFVTEAQASAYIDWARASLYQLQADLRAAREEIAAVERALEGVEETPLARRVGHWIGVAAEETARANAAEAELTRLRVQLQGSAMDHIARDLSDDLQEAEVSKLRERVATLERALKPFAADTEFCGVSVFKGGQSITITAPQWFEAARSVLKYTEA